MAPEAAVDRFRYPGSLFAGRVWIGDGFDQIVSLLGYEDDRHVCLVTAPAAAGASVSSCRTYALWPGSSIIVDRKGENAPMTAQRRGNGSAYTHAMGQKVCILDPFGEVDLPAPLKAGDNLLDAIDPDSDLGIDAAGRVAAALVVVENRNDAQDLAGHARSAARASASAPCSRRPGRKRPAA